MEPNENTSDDTQKAPETEAFDEPAIKTTAEPEAATKALVLYDSAYGNTAKVAEAIGAAIDAPAKTITEVSREDFSSLKLLIVGSPTQGGRPTQALQDFIAEMPSDVLKNVHVAAFDTRFAINEHGLGLKLLMKTIGFAAERIAKSLKAKNGTAVGISKGFIVNDKEGPLKDGELERAAAWGKGIVAIVAAKAE